MCATECDLDVGPHLLSYLRQGLCFFSLLLFMSGKLTQELLSSLLPISPQEHQDYNRCALEIGTQIFKLIMQALYSSIFAFFFLYNKLVNKSGLFH